MDANRTERLDGVVSAICLFSRIGSDDVSLEMADVLELSLRAMTETGSIHLHSNGAWPDGWTSRLSSLDGVVDDVLHASAAPGAGDCVWDRLAAVTVDAFRSLDDPTREPCCSPLRDVVGLLPVDEAPAPTARF